MFYFIQLEKHLVGIIAPIHNESGFINRALPLSIAAKVMPLVEVDSFSVMEEKGAEMWDGVVTVCQGMVVFGSDLGKLQEGKKKDADSEGSFDTIIKNGKEASTIIFWEVTKNVVRYFSTNSAI